MSTRKLYKIKNIYFTKSDSFLADTMYFCEMQFIKRIFSFYIFSNLHVALAGFCMTLITLQKYHIKSNNTAYFVFLSIVISYNFIRFYDIQSQRLQWLSVWFYQFKKLLILLCIYCFLMLLYVLLFTSFNLASLWLLLPFGLMTFFYAIPIYKTKKLEFSFRNFPFLKIFSISFAWAGITVLFPIYEANMLISTTVFWEFFQRFLLLIAITIPFDIRDMYTDTENLKTLPQYIGVFKSKIVGLSLLLIFIVLEFLKPNNHFHPISTCLIACITGLFLSYSSNHKSRFYTGFWVEAIPIFWLVLVMIVS